MPPPKDVPRLPITAGRVQGSVSLRGGVLDDLVLRDYHEEVSPASPLVRVLEPHPTRTRTTSSSAGPATRPA